MEQLFSLGNSIQRVKSCISNPAKELAEAVSRLEACDFLKDDATHAALWREKEILQARLDMSGFKVETVITGDEWETFMRKCSTGWAEHCPNGTESVKKAVAGSNKQSFEYGVKFIIRMPPVYLLDVQTYRETPEPERDLMPRIRSDSKLILQSPGTPQFCKDQSILVEDYETAKHWLRGMFDTFRKYNICYRKARTCLLDPQLYSPDIQAKMRTHQDSGNWEHVFHRWVDKTDSLESTFYAFKDTVAYIISITVVIPSDETILRIMGSLAAVGDSFDDLYSA